MKYEIEELKKEEFPDKLKNIRKSPQKLFFIGNKNLLYQDCFGIIGTRRITDYGIENCKIFTKELVLRNIPIVSGMAIGTDSVAHKTTLEYSGRTIAVLGSGFNHIFPKKNENLFNEIIEKGGLVITEYEKDVKPTKENFPERNRIITALSEGILVIEAGYRSGTSITVRNARKQGKKVFALPGLLNSSVGIGVNKMIKEGAILTTKVEDIISQYPHFMQRRRRTIAKNDNICENVAKEYNQIFILLRKEGKFLDEIISSTGLTIKEILKILTKMQLEGILEQEFNGKYKIK